MMNKFLKGAREKISVVGASTKKAVANIGKKIKTPGMKKKIPSFKVAKKTRGRESAKKPVRLGFYANITSNISSRSDQKAKRRAEERATKPKHPVKRFFWHLHPKRVFRFWFSKKGLILSLKIWLVFALLLAVAGVGVFVYFSRDIDKIRSTELLSQVRTTVNRYEDRNGNTLWEDKGDNDYKIVVDGDKISTYMRQATVAIEDRDFYSHHGVSFAGIIRAVWNNFKGGATQGGSTLTQQLVKQIYFSDESDDRGLTGVPRKIKEMILAIQVERMYDKEQIITLYLNQSPYGGRRNGVESGAQTYFGKSSADLNLAEAAILASIPNNPSWYNPYNEYGHEDLIARQHKVLNDMVLTGFISQEEADAAKVSAIDFREPTGGNVPDSEGHIAIKPVENQFADMKAPHFVMEVKKQVEAALGIKTVRAGGLTIRTTLDYTAQRAAEEAVEAGNQMRYLNGSDNIALSSIDVATGQVIAMVGSIGYEVPIYGQTNAATSLLEPGSSIKPVLDYAPLFVQRNGVNYAPGTIVIDENINSVYCAGNTSGRCGLQNASGQFYGAISIRNALGNSLNIPAVKALIINNSNSSGKWTGSIDNSLNIAHQLGDLSYCANGEYAGLASGIGGGCSVTPTEHANAFASFARGGAYRPISYVLEVKDSIGEVLTYWKDEASKQVVDPQVAYMISDVLSDAAARYIFGGQGYSYGFRIPDVWTATKTGTTDKNGLGAKDSWMMSYSPVVSTAVWNGNHDGSLLGTSSNDIVRRVTNNYMEKVHKDVYAVGNGGSLGGKWTPNQAVSRPSGIQELVVNGKKDIYPSWYNQNTSVGEKVEMEFDSASKKLATQYTPDSTRVKITVTKVKDVVTGKETLYASDGYDPNAYDDVHTSQTASTLSIPLGLVYDPETGIISADILDTTYNLESLTLYTASGAEITSETLFGQSYEFSFVLSSQYLNMALSLTVKNSGGYPITVSGTPTSAGIE